MGDDTSQMVQPSFCLLSAEVELQTTVSIKLLTTKYPDVAVVSDVPDLVAMLLHLQNKINSCAYGDRTGITVDFKLTEEVMQQLANCRDSCKVLET